MPAYATLNDLPIKPGRKVLVRADLNVPLDKGRITDDTRIRESLPTIQYLLKKKAIILLLSHLGRPQGVEVSKTKRFSGTLKKHGVFLDESLRMDPVAERLARLLKQHVVKADDCIGAEVEDVVNELHQGDVAVLENVRFHAEEEANDDAFARGMAEIADFYVNDAFGSSHRAHASIVGIPNYIPGAAGFLLDKEITMLGKALQPKKPFVVVLGGAKVSDKIGVIQNLAKKADKVLIGGTMMFTFLKAQGKGVGNSRLEQGKVRLAKQLLAQYQNKIVLPEDVVVAKSANAKARIVASEEIPAGWSGFDIGPKAIKKFIAQLKNAKTVVWNGPLGMFERAQFAKGTKAIAQTLSTLKATTIVGGGDSAAAVHQWKLGKRFSHVSTGGGASLEFLEGKVLPGVAALEENARRFRIA